MEDDRRADLAFIAGCIATRVVRVGVFDSARNLFVIISGEARRGYVRVFDHSRQCFITGSAEEGAELALYDFGASAHVTLQVTGRGFSGFDYGTSSHFTGSVRGRQVGLFDYSMSAQFDYTLS